MQSYKSSTTTTVQSHTYYQLKHFKHVKIIHLFNNCMATTKIKCYVKEAHTILKKLVNKLKYKKKLYDTI